MPVGMIPISPKKLQKKWFRLEMLNALRKVGREMRNDLNATTRTWEKPVAFDFEISLTRSEAKVRVNPKDGGRGAEIWSMLDKGTEAHTIRAKNAEFLAFSSDYKAKTRPGEFASFAGGSSGETVFAKEVQHPGTEPRDWSVDLAAKYKPRFYELSNEALRRAVRKSGHAI